MEKFQVEERDRMRTARPLGLTPDGRHLVVATDDGEEFAVETGGLARALRGGPHRLGQLEIEMDSALRPRDIQARIRAGESLEDVARAAGVPAERIEAFATPVIAEREHVAGLAQVHPVRRRGETSAHRTLRNTVTDSLAQRGIEPDAVEWDAWKLEDRQWQVLAAYPSGSRRHEALFVYEQTGRFSVAANDEGRWLIGDDTPSHGPQPGRRPESPTLLDDQLAIVRAVQSPATPPAAPTTPDAPAPAASPASAADVEDAYREGELTEVDGVYDIVPVPSSDMDVLYDMLSSFDEDSVKIYAGLVHSPGEDTGVILAVPLDGDPEPAVDEVDAASDADADEPVADEVDAQASEPVVASDPATAGSADAADDGAAPEEQTGPVMEGDLTPAENTIVIDRSTVARQKPVPAPSRTPAPAPAPAEPEQLSLIDDVEDEPAPKPAPKKPARRRRASVPSWDEIMFGSPHQDR